jgi:nitrogen fixation/metabolism regulation signal transduction histidine kinase
MKTIRLVNSILIFIELSLLFTIMFAIGAFVIFDGEEKSGTLVTVGILSYFLFCLVLSLVIARKLYAFLEKRTARMNFIFLY